MIIACPACATRYVVPDTAISAEGRTVRCAKCRHSWHQALDNLPPQDVVQSVEEKAAEPAPPPPPPPPPVQPVEPEVAVIERPAVTEAPQLADIPPQATAEPVVEVAPATSAAAVYDDLAPPPVEPKAERKAKRAAKAERAVSSGPHRNWLRLWTYAGAIFAAVALGIVVAVSYWGLPDWVSVNQPAFGEAQTDLVLNFPAGEQDRRRLPNGTEFFGASGTITNVGSKARTLSPILILLRDEKDRVVYTWEIAPPKRTLGPGESVTIHEVLLDLPKSAKFAEIGWKPS